MAGNGKTGARVLVVDDDAGIRDLIVSVLADTGYAPAAAATGEEALELTRRAPPAAAIVDVKLPGISGYEVCRRLRLDHGDGLPIVFVSGERTEAFDRVGGLMIGADDYVVKPFAPDELLERLGGLLRRADRAPVTPWRLTPRELEILRLLAEGNASATIASDLVISPKTVSTHVERILGKMGVTSRAQAVALAYGVRLIEPHAGGPIG